MHSFTNWLDRVIGWVSPKAGLLRMRARLGHSMIKMAYDGGSTGRRTDGWVATGSSAEAEIGPALPNLRNRSRELIRNNVYGIRAVKETVGHQVRTGIIAKTKIKGNPTLSAMVDLEWQEWIKYCDADEQLDFNGLQCMVARAIFESGEAIVRFRNRRPSDGLKVPLQIQVLESDFLDSNRTGMAPNYEGQAVNPGGYMIHGVEFDQLGRRVAYWLFGNHPGEVLQVTAFSGLVSKRVPASEVLHIYLKDRPGQVRGVPRMAPVMTTMRDLDGYEDAYLLGRRIDACLAAFVTQPEGADGPMLTPGGTVAVDQAGHRLESFEPGMVEYLKPGEDVKFNTPAAATGYGEYIVKNQAKIAVGVDLTYEQLTGDLSRVNYSSYRAGQKSFQNSIEVFQWVYFIPMFLEKVRNRWAATAFAAGVIPMERIDTEWTPPSFGTVDPLKDALAVLTEIRIGRLTWAQAVADYGWDADEQMAEIARLNAEFDKLGIVLDCDPRKVTKTGASSEPVKTGSGE